MSTITPTPAEHEFIDAYIACAYFTDTGEDHEAPSDCELCPHFKRRAVIDCLAFYARVSCYLEPEHIAQAGHDFWLTRNQHGTGFWDRPEIYTNAHQRALFSKVAQDFGSHDIEAQDETK